MTANLFVDSLEKLWNDFISLLPSIAAGIFGAGFNLSFFNTLLEVCPPERRPSYVAINTTLINVAAFLAPLLGTYLANRLDIRVSLFIAGAVRLVGAGFFYQLTKNFWYTTTLPLKDK